MESPNSKRGKRVPASRRDRNASPFRALLGTIPMAVTESWTQFRHMHLHPWVLIREGFYAFLEDNALPRGAAIAFYAVTAIAPVLFIATAVAGFFLGRDAASGAVAHQLRLLMSPESASLVQSA